MPSYEPSNGVGGGEDIMTAYPDYLFIQSLRKDLRKRTIQDLQIIYANLRTMEALQSIREPSLRSLCKAVRYESHEANDILYCRGELSTCWYVLLSGSVFIDGCMYLPRASFGKRTGTNPRRDSECLILERSEMLVIDYPDTIPQRPVPRQSVNSMNLERLLAEQEEVTNRRRLPSTNPPGSPLGSIGAASLASSSTGVSVGHSHGHGHGRPAEPYPGDFMMSMSGRVRAESDTSSAYSGSDTMGSSAQTCSSENDDLDYTDPVLVETNVDSDDDEEEEEDIDDLDCCRDTVRECLEKDPSERTGDDIDILLEFTQQLKAFSNMTMAVRRALCADMVFAVVDKAGTVVMNDGEELDSWSVIVNGTVEIDTPSGAKVELGLGDSFGITPTMEKMYHAGIMKTKVDDCQFACITQTDYYRILHQGEENTLRHTEGDRTVLVTEQRRVEGGNRSGQIIIRGTAERLMQQLVEENSGIDPTYVEDFLLTHRTFIESPVAVANQLLEWFNDPKLRDRVTRVVLLWVNNHFTDFEMDPDMMTFLEKFENGLERQQMVGQLRLLNIACAAKARTRTITLARPNRDEPLQFTLLSAGEGFGIFVSKVEKSSRAEEVGLKRGDQILEVNGQSFDRMSTTQALETLRKPTHLAITVKSNLLAFKEIVNSPDSADKGRCRKGSDASVDHGMGHSLHSDSGQIPNGSSTLLGNFTLEAMAPSPHKGKSKEPNNKDRFMTLGHRTRIKNVFSKLTQIPTKFLGDNHVNGGSSDDSLYPPSISSSGKGTSSKSRSNPDLTSLSLDDSIASAMQFGCNLSANPVRSEPPEHVLKVYKADQSYKYLLVNKETTAREVVMLALREFGLQDAKSTDFSLCEVSVSHGTFIKQRRLPDQLQNLAERMGLSSRYYLRNNNVTDPLVPDEMVPELARESNVSLLSLRAVEVATQLTLQDFAIFRRIEATEYVDDLFDNKKSRYGLPVLSQFSELVNQEMFWVVSEVVSEHNLVKRARLIKQFIKIARQCKECRNFNSMFAILSGLGHGTVERLKNSWERVPQKYMNMFTDMQALMDPSRNMAKYRNLLASENAQPPVIPFWPVVKKDLTFIHLGNDTMVDSLYNFEKLRMIAKEVRSLINMCSAPYDLLTMLELGGQPPSAAIVALNQMLTGGQPSLATIKKRKKSVATPNPKKMFEESQMVRRVKAYLSNLKVNTNEDVLRQMSFECEGGGNLSTTGSSSIGGSATLRRRQPSPTLSTASSNSQTSIQSDQRKPKFGAQSPHQVRKLLALSEPKTRPYQPPKPIVVGSSHSLSPANSPAASRKSSAVSLLHSHAHAHFGRTNGSHERSHSDTPSLVPVDLSDSTSVTSLGNLPLRKSQISFSGYTSSNDGGFHQGDGGLHGDADSGHGDSHSNSSNEMPSGHASVPHICRSMVSSSHRHHSPPPPPPQRRFSAHPASSASSMHYHRPPFPAAVPVLPPIPGRQGMIVAPSVRPRRPPDYTPPPVFRQPQAHPRSGVNRTRSHDSIDPVCSRYIDADEEGAQVSAV